MSKLRSQTGLRTAKTVGIRDTLGCEMFLHTAQLGWLWSASLSGGSCFPLSQLTCTVISKRRLEKHILPAWLKKVKIVSGLYTVCVKATTVFRLYRELKMEQIWPFITFFISLNWKRPQVL